MADATVTAGIKSFGGDVKKQANIEMAELLRFSISIRILSKYSYRVFETFEF